MQFKQFPEPGTNTPISHDVLEFKHVYHGIEVSLQKGQQEKLIRTILQWAVRGFKEYGMTVFYGALKLVRNGKDLNTCLNHLKQFGTEGEYYPILVEVCSIYHSAWNAEKNPVPTAKTPFNKFVIEFLRLSGMPFVGKYTDALKQQGLYFNDRFITNEQFDDLESAEANFFRFLDTLTPFYLKDTTESEQFLSAKGDDHDMMFSVSNNPLEVRVFADANNQDLYLQSDNYEGSSKDVLYTSDVRVSEFTTLLIAFGGIIMG